MNRGKIWYKKGVEAAVLRSAPMGLFTPTEMARRLNDEFPRQSVKDAIKRLVTSGKFVRISTGGGIDDRKRVGESIFTIANRKSQI